MPYRPSKQLLGLVLLAAACLAHAGTGRILVTEAWSRPTPPGIQSGVVYLALQNQTSVADRLLRLSSPIARSVELHETRETQGLMTMRQIQSLPLPAGATIAAAPGGLHIMLLGLKQPLVAGREFELTLTFEHSGPLNVRVAVREAS